LGCREDDLERSFGIVIPDAFQYQIKGIQGLSIICAGVNRYVDCEAPAGWQERVTTRLTPTNRNRPLTPWRSLYAIAGAMRAADFAFLVFDKRQQL
jgi:hypothetical protein